MIHWGWRPLIASVFISVLVAGCATSNGSALTVTPTEYPPVTLVAWLPAATAPPMQTPRAALATPFDYQDTLLPAPTPATYIVQPGDTLLDIALKFGVDVERLRFVNGGLDPISLQSGQTLIIPTNRDSASNSAVLPTSTPLALTPAPPTCYETATAQTLCMGAVQNPYREPIERVALSVQLFGRDGDILAEKVIDLEQRTLPAASAAPYGVIFDIGWTQYAGAAVRMRSAEVIDDYSARFVRLQVENSVGGMVGERFVVSAVVSNPGPRDAGTPRVSVMLYDDHGQVVGYRVAQMAQALPAGERLPLHLELVPQPQTTPIDYSLHVEAPPR